MRGAPGERGRATSEREGKEGDGKRGEIRGGGAAKLLVRVQAIRTGNWQFRKKRQRWANGRYWWAAEEDKGREKALRQHRQ